MELKVLIPVVIVVLLGLVVLAGLLMKGKGGDDSFPYQRVSVVFSPAERSFFGVLEKAVPPGYRVLGKVRVADVITVKKLGNRAVWQRHFNRISSKHFDFLICRADDLSVVCAVELDDASHKERSRQTRDAFLSKVCGAADLPLIQTPAKHAYSVQEIQEVLSGIIERASTGVGA